MKPPKIDWSVLESATGDASRIGDWRDDLGSTRAPTRKRAMQQLSAALCSQGVVNEASLAAVPFLFAALSRRGMRDRDAIVNLLVGIAVGDHGRFLDGSGTPRARALGRSSKARSIEGQCYQHVHARLDVLRELLGASDAKLRASAAFALAWFPDPDGHAATRLLARATVERDELAEASIAITLGHLGVADARPILRELLIARSKLLRTAAAIGLAYLDPKDKLDDIRGTLGDALGDLERTRLPGNRGDLGKHADTVLAALQRR